MNMEHPKASDYRFDRPDTSELERGNIGINHNGMTYWVFLREDGEPIARNFSMREMSEELYRAIIEQAMAILRPKLHERLATSGSIPTPQE